MNADVQELQRDSAIRHGSARPPVAILEAQLAGVPLETPEYLRKFILELALLLPQNPESQRLFRAAFESKELTTDEKIYFERLSMRAGNISPLFVRVFRYSAFAVLGIGGVASMHAIFGRVNETWQGLAIFLTLVGLAIILLPTRQRLTRMIDRLCQADRRRLQSSGVAEYIAAGPAELLRIYDYAVEPWGRMFLGPKPKSLRGCARLLAINLPWYLRPPQRHYPLGWLPLVLLGIPGAAMFFICMGDLGTSRWAQGSAPHVITWWNIVTVALYLAALVSIPLQEIYTARQSRLLAALVAYMRERFVADQPGLEPDAGVASSPAQMEIE